MDDHQEYIQPFSGPAHKLSPPPPPPPESSKRKIRLLNRVLYVGSGLFNLLLVSYGIAILALDHALLGLGLAFILLALGHGIYTISSFYWKKHKKNCMPESYSSNAIITFFYVLAVELGYLALWHGGWALHTLFFMQGFSVVLVGVVLAVVISAKELYRILRHKVDYIQLIEFGKIQSSYGDVITSTLVGFFVYSLFLAGLTGVIVALLAGSATVTMLAYGSLTLFALYHLRLNFYIKPETNSCLLGYLSYYLGLLMSIISLEIGGLSLLATLACCIALVLSLVPILVYFEVAIRKNRVSDRGILLENHDQDEQSDQPHKVYSLFASIDSLFCQNHKPANFILINKLHKVTVVPMRRPYCGLENLGTPSKVN